MTKHEADVIGGLNMTDQISNEAYKQIMIAAQDENEVGDVLIKIREEIDRQEKWLMSAGYNAYNVDIAFSSIKSVLAKSEGIIPALQQEPMFDKIKGYINHIRNTGLGKKKSLEFIEKFIDGLKVESEE